MNLSHRIENSPEIKLHGISMETSLIENKTQLIWQKFMPLRAKIQGRLNEILFSVEDYPENYFNPFNPNTPFQKWAACAFQIDQELPKEFKEVIIPAGLYVVFIYTGKGSEIGQTYQYIISKWLPQSGYKLANRPHFAKMGSDYKNEDTDSKEELWIPIKSR